MLYWTAVKRHRYPRGFNLITVDEVSKSLGCVVKEGKKWSLAIELK